MKRIRVFLIAAVMTMAAYAQMNSEETAIVRAILDSAGKKDVPVESVAQADESGRITTLDLSNKGTDMKGISILPEEIGQLTSLTKLDVQYNNLRELPPAVGKLSSLEQFDARYNQLESLPADFFYLKKLTFLQLWGNQFKTLSEDVGKLISLTELYLLHNKLIDLPKAITKMKTLTYIDFEDNFMCNPSPEVVAWIVKKDKQWKSKQNCYGQ
jgi:Leucine-rich repeat (LRR) protein